jgi:hypothetical protein
MYYEEKEDRGLWYYRTSPRDDWREFDNYRYAAKIASLQQQLRDAHATIRAGGNYA